MRTEVAEQVKASSTYGTTKIEAQARLAKIERLKAKQQQHQHTKDNDDDNNDIDAGSKDMTDVSDIDEDQDDDDAFFVNVGNLEMDEGYEDADVAEIDYEELEKKSGKEKAGKKKRKRKKVDASSEGGSATKKKMKKATDSTDKEKTKQNAITETTQLTKTKKVKTQKSTEDGSKVGKKKKKVLVKKPKPDVVPDIPVEKEEEAEKPSDDSSCDSVDEPEEENISPQEQAELKSAKTASEKQMKEVKHFYNKCVSAIQQMTEEHLPRKIKGKIKVALTVPDNKKAGDTVKFNNPHVPDQMLRVLIPKGCVPGATFNVSVPRPDTRTNKTTVNKFSREAQELLTEYSEAYDVWCQVEETYKNLLPYKGAKKKKFKQTAQRLKKFDEMVNVFPNKELATPVDVVFLRLVVRRSRSNAKKKLQRTQQILETCSSPTTTKKTGNTPLADPEEPPHDIELHVPGKGTHFPTISFNSSDFSRDK
uniref:Uncharacterized protein n=1 Tax=Attheya septentrionalis TaxID=420275 RepID=A0A7S2UN61_9STRA